MRSVGYVLLFAAIVLIFVRILLRNPSHANITLTRIKELNLISSNDCTKVESLSDNRTSPLTKNHSLIQETSTVLGLKKRKLYGNFKGRYGNILFEFAALYGLSQTTNSDFYFKDNGQAYRFKKMFPKLSGMLHLVSRIPKDMKTVLEQAPNKFTHRVEEEIASAQKDVYVHGYLGVFGYWWPKFEKQLRCIYEISEELQNRAKNYLLDIVSPKIPDVLINNRWGKLKADVIQNTTKESFTLVGIQVRRGDKAGGHSGWVVPKATYFEQAMDYFQKKYKNVYFIVVSENKSWAKKNIVRHNVIYSDSNYDLLELTLLSLCDHTIVSVGTFSWWAAWLAGGEVVYYPHHVKPNTVVGNFFNNTHYFLPHWIPLE